MEKPFSAYQGGDPYIFVCYARDDSGIVYPEIEWLHASGINVWYDEGITPGEEWNEELGRAIDGAAHVVFFVTPAAATSRHCRDEIQFAISRKRDILAVHLVPTELPLGLDLALGARQAIIKSELSARAYRAKLLAYLRAEGSDSAVSAEPTKAAPAAGRRWPAITIVAIAIVAIAVFLNRGQLLPGLAVKDASRIAVLPFENLGPPQDEYFATDDVTGVAAAIEARGGRFAQPADSGLAATAWLHPKNPLSLSIELFTPGATEE